MANTTEQKSPYRKGDGLTHATGKPRLGVIREGGCVCGCGETPVKPRSRFIPGHDARMYALARNLKSKDPEVRKATKDAVTKRQTDYLKGRGLI